MRTVFPRAIPGCAACSTLEKANAEADFLSGRLILSPDVRTTAFELLRPPCGFQLDVTVLTSIRKKTHPGAMRCKMQQLSQFATVVERFLEYFLKDDLLTNTYE